MRTMNQPLSGPAIARHPLPPKGGEGKGEGAVSIASGFTERLRGISPRIEPMNLGWRASVLECGSPLPLLELTDIRKRQGTAALQNLAEFGRFMGRGLFLCWVHGSNALQQDRGGSS